MVLMVLVNAAGGKCCLSLSGENKEMVVRNVFGENATHAECTLVYIAEDSARKVDQKGRGTNNCQLAVLLLAITLLHLHWQLAHTFLSLHWPVCMCLLAGQSDWTPI